jgi:hypothetical protein
MLQSPKKRSWPSRNCMSCPKPRRQPPGDTKGRMPSITRTSASALQKISALTTTNPAADQRRGALPAGVPALCMARKKSDDGSSTITSLFLLKLCL